MLHKKRPPVPPKYDPIKQSRHSTIGLLEKVFQRSVPFSTGTLWMALKDNLTGEIRSSCSKVTDVATISNLVESKASVIRTYISLRVHTR